MGSHSRNVIAVNDGEVGTQGQRVHRVRHRNHGGLQDIDLVDGLGADYTPARC